MVLLAIIIHVGYLVSRHVKAASISILQSNPQRFSKCCFSTSAPCGCSAQEDGGGAHASQLGPINRAPSWLLSAEEAAATGAAGSLKHTEWITAREFSITSLLIASALRSTAGFYF